MADVTTPTEEPAALSAESDAGFDALLAEVARPPSLRAQLVEDVKARVGLTTLDLDVGARSLELEPGAVVDGRYRVQSVLGHGGMGVVYAAESIQTGRKVAVKCIALHGSAAILRSTGRGEHPALVRFRREARAVASIRHPNVVDVYDAGGQGALPYLVMELLEGESLRARMQRSRLVWDDARPLFLAVLEGVAAAHRAGVIHRDIKPDNIFLACAPGSAGVVPKVLDFGIAAVRETASEVGQALTRTGTVLGTPSYMAPEQLTGGSVDVRTDVYGLGVMLYEMLSGQLPFSARTAPELAVLQATRAALPLSQHCPELSGMVESTVMRALAHDPAERYPHVEAFIAAVAGTQAGRERFSFKAWQGVGLAVILGLGIYLGFFASPPAARESVIRSPGVASQAPSTARVIARTPTPALAPQPTPTVTTVPLPVAPAPSAPLSTPQPKAQEAKSSVRRQDRSNAPARALPPAAKAPTDLSVDEF